MRYTYDNSEANDGQSEAARRGAVTWGPQSSDEMGNLGLQLLASPADRALLVRTFAEREARDNVRGAEIRVKHAPDDPAERTWLGSSYLEVGRVADAIAQLEIAVRQRPDAVAGPQLSRRRAPGGRPHGGRHRAAAGGGRRWRRVMRTCSSTSAKRSRLADARQPPPIGSRERSPSIRVSRSRTRSSACCSSRTGACGEALPHLQRAVDLAPDSATAHSDLGGALAEAGRFDDAATHLRRALELDPAYAPARENLSRLSRR